MNRILPSATSAALALAVASTSCAQSFAFTDFTSTSGISLRGSAAAAGNSIRLTDLVSGQNGAAWYTTPQLVVGGFDTSFVFSIAPGPNRAEGMAFVIHNATTGANTLGGGVWGLGYGPGSTNSPIANSIAIELDTYRDVAPISDTSNNEISIHTRGTAANHENESASIGRVTPTTILSTGAQHTMRIRYVPGTLEVFVDNAATPSLSVPYDILGGGTHLVGTAVGGLNLPNGTAYLGFSATTGAGTLTERVLIHSWTWASTSPNPPCYDGTIGVAAGGSPSDVLRINGSAGGPLRKVVTPAFDPWTIDLSAPPSQTSAPFVLWGTLGAADGSAATVLPWGTLCFQPVSPLIFPVGPAPVSIQFPAGLPIVGTLTLQAIMSEDPASMSALALTNAVVVELAMAAAPRIQSITPSVTTVGATIVINGAGFSPAANLSVGGVPTTPTSVSATSIQFAYPAGLTCDASVVVQNPDGQIATGVINPTPTVTNRVNSQGPASGGTSLILIGSGLSSGSSVTIGGNPATVTSASGVAMFVTTPPGVPGVQPVVITTLGGCTTQTTFTYL